jgi:hypothetical protein
MGSMVAEIVYFAQGLFVCAGMDINTAKKQDIYGVCTREYEGQADVNHRRFIY